MKKSVVYYALVLLVCNSVDAQNVIVKGRVKCLNATNSTKGAENVIIVPAFMPSKSTVTVSRPSGYFEFNTGVPLPRLQDKQISIYTVSKCTNCKEGTKRVFISEDQDRQNRDATKTYVTIRDWSLNAACTQAELPAFEADSLLALIAQQPGQNMDYVSKSSALLGAPAFLNFLTNIVEVAGTLPANFGEFRLQELFAGKIHYGQFLLASPLYQSANTGFNFSPSRDISEAVFWNPSAIGNSRSNNNVSLLTNLKNNTKLSGFTRLSDHFSLGLGGIYTNQNELRSGDFVRTGGNKWHPDSLRIKVTEFVAHISPVYKVSNKLSLGISAKSIWQNFNIPYHLLFLSSGNAVFTDTIIIRQRFDVDVSFTYKINPSLQVGLNAMNLAGTELYADAFAPGQTPQMRNQRSLGVGACYKYKRWNIGVDALFTEDDFYDASIGLNYVPFNYAQLSAGVSVKQLGYSVAFKMKHFRIAYIDDNNWLANDTKKGKSPFLNGRFHGGFIFNFD